jgi:hypothetical protein
MTAPAYLALQLWLRQGSIHPKNLTP